MMGIVIGGAEGVFDEYEQAKDLYIRIPFITLVTNSTIENFPDHIDHAVTLHPDVKLTKWLELRARNGLSPPTTIWSHRQGIQNRRRTYDVVKIDRFMSDRGGSVGLLAVDVAIRLGCDRVVLCGVPLTREAGHFKRRRPWLAADKYHRAWLAACPELAPVVRSFSGWTAELFGKPE